MTILIDPRSTKPIYEQIADQIRATILQGDCPADTPLPSIRALAGELKVSVITTKRAYEELEGQGFLYTVPGKGCFVSPVTPARAGAYVQGEIRAHLRQVRRLMTLGGLTQAQVQALWEELQDEHTV